MPLWVGEGWDRIHRENVKRMTFACVKVGIKKLEGIRFIHRAHSKFMPLIADTYSAELQGRHTHTRKGGERAITSELGRRRGERVQRCHLKKIGG